MRKRCGVPANRLRNIRLRCEESQKPLSAVIREHSAGFPQNNANVERSEAKTSPAEAAKQLGISRPARRYFALSPSTPQAILGVPAAKSPPSRFAILVALSALSVLPVNIIAPSLPKIAGEFNAGSALINLAVAGYAVGTALVQLISGAISDRFGRKPVALISIVLFIFASIGCAFAPQHHDLACLPCCASGNRRLLFGRARCDQGDIHRP